MIMDTVMLAWFFLTPVVYPITNLPTSYTVLGITLNVHRLVYILNPMASLIAAYRDLLYWGYRTDLDFLLRTAVTSLAILWPLGTGSLCAPVVGSGRGLGRRAITAN